MASNEDDVDFHSKFTLYDDQNKELLNIGLTQKKMMLIFLIMLGVIFIVLVAFNAIETKDLRELTGLLKELADEI